MTIYGKSHVRFYDTFFNGLPGDEDFYVEEAKKSGSPILELGCGNGRILIPTAEAGLEIVGLDVSLDMLADARKKVSALDADVSRRIELVHGDMRDIPIDREFNLITIPYRAFLHLLTVEDQKKALASVKNHLAENGRLILNIFDPRLDVINGPANRLRRCQELNDPETGHLIIMWSATNYNLQDQSIHETTTFEEVDGSSRVVNKTYSPLTLRWVYRYEMQHLLELCGFKIDALYGDFQRGPFRYGNEQIWVCVKG